MISLSNDRLWVSIAGILLFVGMILLLTHRDEKVIFIERDIPLLCDSTFLSAGLNLKGKVKIVLGRDQDSLYIYLKRDQLPDTLIGCTIFYHIGRDEGSPPDSSKTVGLE